MYTDSVRLHCEFSANLRNRETFTGIILPRSRNRINLARLRFILVREQYSDQSAIADTGSLEDFVCNQNLSPYW